MWYHKCKLYYNCHRESSNYYNFWDKSLGFPAIIIQIFNASSLFANYGSIEHFFILLIGILTLISSGLIACQKYFELQRFKYIHDKYMFEYSRILYSIEKIIILFKNNPEIIITNDSINTILTDIEKLREENIFFPEKIWIKYNNKYKIKLEEYDVNTSDSINIILKSLKSKKDLTFLNTTNSDTFYNANPIINTITYNNTSIEKNDINNKETNNNEFLAINVNEDSEKLIDKSKDDVIYEKI